MKKLNLKLLTSAMALGLAALTTVGSTYAWWTVNTTATLTNVKMDTTAAGSGVFISLDGTNFKDQLDLQDKFDGTFQPATSCNGVNFYGLKSTKYTTVTDKYNKTTDTTVDTAKTYYKKTTTEGVDSYAEETATAENLSTLYELNGKSNYFNYEALSAGTEAKKGSYTSTTEGSVTTTVYNYLDIPVFFALNDTTKSVTLGCSMNLPSGATTEQKALAETVRYSVLPYKATAALGVYSAITDASTTSTDVALAAFNNLYGTHIEKKGVSGDGTTILTGWATSDDASFNKTTLSSAIQLIDNNEKVKVSYTAKDGLITGTSSVKGLYTQSGEVYTKIDTETTAVEGTTYYERTVSASGTIEEVNTNKNSEGLASGKATFAANSDLATPEYVIQPSITDTSYRYSVVTLRFWIEGNDFDCYNSTAGQAFSGLSFTVTAA